MDGCGNRSVCFWCWLACPSWPGSAQVLSKQAADCVYRCLKNCGGLASWPGVTWKRLTRRLCNWESVCGFSIMRTVSSQLKVNGEKRKEKKKSIGFNPFTSMLAVPPLEKRPIKMPNVKSFRWLFPTSQERVKGDIQIQGIESRLVIRLSNILSAGVYVCTFQLGYFTGWGSEEVKGTMLPEQANNQRRR